MLPPDIKATGALLVAVLAVVLVACSTPPTVVSKNAAPASSSASTRELQFKTPGGWSSETPSSSMRVAQYQLPAADGDAEPASLVVYYFGAGQGGSVQANLDRWTGQIQQPNGGSSKDKAKTESLTVNGMNVTLLDVSGTYAGGDMGGGAGQSKPNFRMRAGVIESPKGGYFIKLVGPEKTVGKWDDSFMEFIKSAEFKG
ncbi:MAG TPA: hypothetical protein VN937_15820 [Blastocatellia bacterium]|nr:hypothetical protein [Blastocatellia bacterium]